MSTILDALRKVEGERRASGHSTREQLLFLPQVTPLPFPSRKGIWAISLALVGVGFAGGVGITLFRPGPTASVPAAQPGKASVNEQMQAALAQSERPTLPTAVAAASRLPEKSPASPAPILKPRSQDLPEPGVGDSLFPAPGQRSPFASREKHHPNKPPQGTSEPQTPSPSSLLGIPKVSLNLLQWSPQAERRLAFISINGGPMLMVHEGDTVSDFTVERILPDAVELSFNNATLVVKPFTNSSSPAPLAP